MLVDEGQVDWQKMLIRRYYLYVCLGIGELRRLRQMDIMGL